MRATDSSPGHRALRHGRWSEPFASYFVTACTRDRRHGLARADVFQGLLQIADRLADEDILHLRVMTLMPDHLHGVVRLGSRTDLSNAMRFFKGRASVVLRRHGLAWQKGAFYDHRLRPSEPLLPVYHYIFMNPYRLGLLQPAERWEFFHCCEEDRAWYEPGKDGDIPYPEWLPSL